VAQRSRIALYAAEVLSAAAAPIHLLAMPVHFEEWGGYGAFFLLATVLQGFYALALLRRPWPSLFSLGIAAANLGIVVLWLVTRTSGIPFFRPHAEEVEAVGEGLIWSRRWPSWRSSRPRMGPPAVARVWRGLWQRRS
jgi:hypothetical protein